MNVQDMPFWQLVPRKLKLKGKNTIGWGNNYTVKTLFFLEGIDGSYGLLTQQMLHKKSIQFVS